MIHHTSEESCPSCDSKLLTAHDTLVSWFKRLKKRYPSVHVSWAYRGPEDQDKAFKEGKSHARYPHSPHNAVKDGKPCSRAIDIFQIDEDGVARFSGVFCAKVNADNERDHEPLFWGGMIKGISDFCHFQLHE